jgi:hypothetical protein
MGEKDILDFQLFFEGQNGRDGAAVDQYRFFQQETGRAVAGKVRTVATQYPDIHPGLPDSG